MGLISNGIDRVGAFGLAAGVRAGGSAVDEPGSALIKWRSGHAGKLHQVYVNGKLAGITMDVQQRQMIVAIPSHTNSAVRIEVYAVEVSQANVDFSGELQSPPQAGRIKINWFRGMSLPYEGMAQIYSDGGSGQIDYENPVSKEDIQLWPSRQDKFGFGLGRFGEGDFGYDGSAAIGFGQGAFGEGDFGFDADEVSWVSSELENGRYKFAVKVTDRFWQVSEAQETDEIAVIRTATPAEGLDVESYDKSEDELVLRIQ